MVARLRYLFQSSLTSIKPERTTFRSIPKTRVKGFLMLGGIVIVLVLLNTGPVNFQRFRVTPESRIGLLQYLPQGYYENSDKYPLVIFLHGIVERGINSRQPDLLESQSYWVDNLGPPEWVANGKDFPFILISPQLKSNHEYWPVEYIMEVVNWARENLRVDEKRIYITGLSLGGGAVFSAIQQHPGLFAAAVPICAHWNDPAFADDLAKEKVAIWAFHGDDDPQVPLHTNSFMIDSINKCIPAAREKARLTVFHGLRHAVWDRAYTPGAEGEDQDIYEWMLEHVKLERDGKPLPAADAGPDFEPGPDEGFLLDGKGYDPEGEALTYRWHQMSGPPATIDDPGAHRTYVRIKRKGTYFFRLTVSDPENNTDQDFVKIVVR